MRAMLVAGGWLWAAAIVWLSLTPSPPDLGLGIESADKLQHVAAYALLMTLFAWLYRSRASRLGYAALWIALGVGLEFAQAATGYRDFELADMAADAIGVAAGIALAIILSKVAPGPERGTR
jgi:VanZ family protein